MPLQHIFLRDRMNYPISNEMIFLSGSEIIHEKEKLYRRTDHPYASRSRQRSFRNGEVCFEAQHQSTDLLPLEK